MGRHDDIDVIKLIEDIGKNATFKKFLLKPSTITKGVAAGALQTMVCVSDNLVLDALLVFLGGYSIISAARAWKYHSDINYQLVLELEKTGVYSRLSENYFTFIHHVVKFAKQFGLKDSKDVILLFELMIKNGLFSATGKHEYRSYKYIYPEVHGTLGAQVMTGTCVCRHMSSVFADLLYRMNMQGCNVIVKVNREDEIKKFLKMGRKKEFNHAVLGVVENCGKYVYDPVNAVFAGRCESKFRGYSMDEVAVGIVKERPGYYFPDSNSMSLNKLHMENLKAYNKASLDVIDQEDIIRRRERIAALYNDNIDMFNGFYNEFLSLLQQVASDVEQIMPKVDEELTEWVLKY